MTNGNELSKTLGTKQVEAARGLASHASPAFLATASAIVKAKEDWKGGPVKIWQAAKLAYPGDAFDVFPIPESKTGNNPAIFMVDKPSGKDGKLMPKETNFYNVFADSLPPVVTILQQIEWLQRMGNDKMKLDGIPADWLNEYQNHAIKRENMLKKLGNKQTSFRSAIKDGFKLIFKLDMVNELAGCHAEVVPSAIEGEYENIVRVRSTVPGRELEDNEAFSLDAFGKLDPAKAFEGGGTWQALMATKKRKVEGQGAADGAAKPQTIKTVDTYVARITDVHAFMDEVWSAKDKAQYEALLKTLGPKGPAGSDNFALSLYSIHTMLNQVYRHDGIRARAEKLFEADVAGDGRAAA